MPDPGAIAEWGGDLIAMISLVRANRQGRANDFFRVVENESGKAADALLELMEKEDLFSEIIERGTEAAGRSAHEAKRRLLGRVVAGAIVGTGFATPDQHLLLIKTVDAIDPVHVQLLVKLATPIPGAGEFAGQRLEGRWTENEILVQSPELGALGRPVLAVLEREGLVDKIGVTSFDGHNQSGFAPSAYGRLLLTYLGPEDLGAHDLRATAIACRYEPEPTPVIVVRNIGPGRARNVRVSVPGSENVLCEDVPFFDLDPLTERALRVEIPMLTSGPPYEVRLKWDDSRLDVVHQFTVSRRE
jgi:hypothetical protein